MGEAYRHPALKELKEQQARYAPRERLLEQINRAEALLAEIEEGRRYPYEYLLFRITGFRAELTSAQVLDGSGGLRTVYVEPPTEIGFYSIIRY